MRQKLVNFLETHKVINPLILDQFITEILEEEGGAIAHLTIDTKIDPDLDLFGKKIGDLQRKVDLVNDTIQGISYYVTDYTGFDSTLYEGNYIVLHFTCPAAKKITVEIINGTSGPSTLDDDGIIVLKITDVAEQYLEVVCSDEDKGIHFVKTISLENLELEEKEEI